MERQKALVVAGIAAAVLGLGGVAYAAGSGLVASDPDQVGNLSPVAAELTTPTTAAAPAATAPEITLYVDPVTGTVSTSPPPSTLPAAGAVPAADPAVPGGAADPALAPPAAARAYDDGEHEDHGEDHGEDHEDEEHEDDD